MRLSELWRFPVKSLRGQRLQRAEVGPRGLLHDREWMLVDPEGVFLSQRRVPRMALVETRLEDGVLALSAPGMAPLQLARAVGRPLEVQIWRDTCEAETVDPAADRWLSQFLGTACRLVRLPETSLRPVDPDYGRAGDQVGFADGFPLLLISQASLDDLNRRLEAPLPMVRFRPNLVVTGTAPYAEDRWRRIRIGALEFRVVKPCSRCPIPTIDPQTAERGAEPLRTLMGYRRRGNRVYFGQNLLQDGQGPLEEGMEVEVLESADEG